MKPAVQVHFLSEMSENIRKKCDRRVAKGAGCFFRQLSSAAAFVMMIEPHHPFTHEQATPSGDFLEKNHENLS